MRLLLIALALLSLSSSAFSQTMAPESNITLVRTGWELDSFAVVTTDPIINPAACPTPDGYISAMNFRGYRTYYDAVLTALTSDLPVTIVVHNTQCFQGRPRIIGINFGR